MPISGILVSCKPQDMGEVSGKLRDLEWTEVHFQEPDGRIVLTVEAESTEEAMARLTHVKTIPNVISAEMVEHYMGDEDLPAAGDTTLRAALERLNQQEQADSRRTRRERSGPGSLRR